MYQLLISLFLVACVAAGPTPEFTEQTRFQDCFEQNSLQFDKFYSCMMVKSFVVLDNAAQAGDIPLMDGVNFVRITPMDRTAKNLKVISEQKLLDELPTNNVDKVIKLGTMLFDSARSFMKSHSLKVDVPDEMQISRALTEGRAKIKKMIMPFIATIGVKFLALMPIVISGLALLTAKALFIGKTALLVAGIIAFQKIFSGGFSYPKNQQFAGWYDNGANAGWASQVSAAAAQPAYYRSLQDKNDMSAQKLAYVAHVPVMSNVE